MSDDSHGWEFFTGFLLGAVIGAADELKGQVPVGFVVLKAGVDRDPAAVEADGSVYFEAPAGRSLYFQLLDADRRCLQTMRSFTGLMPGEKRGCVGCHEMHSTTPAPRGMTTISRGSASTMPSSVTKRCLPCCGTISISPSAL